MSDDKAQVKIGADVAELKTAINEATATVKSGMDRMNADMREAVSGASAIGSGFTNMASMVKTALAGIATAAVVKETIDLADAYTKAEARLKLYTSSQEEQKQVAKELYEISQGTRSSYMGNLDLYAKLTQAFRGQNVTQHETLQITETLNKAFAVSGASTEARRAATIQLSQALASGVLRGDEFNSVMESGGRIVQLFTDYTGKSVGELRKMAEQGQLTASVVREALAAGVQKVNKEFATLPITVGDATQSLGNSIGSLIADINNASGATSGLASAIKGLADTIDSNKGRILSFFRELGAIAGSSFSGAEMMAEAAGQGVEKLERKVTSSVPAIKSKLKELEDEAAKVNESMALRSSRGASTDYESEQLRQINHQIGVQQGLLKGLTSSPYVTGEAAGKLDIVAGAWQRIGFNMQGTRAATEEEKKASDKAHEASLKYSETREQSLNREFQAAYNAARGEQERAAVVKKYHDEMKKYEEQQSKAANKGKGAGADTRGQEWRAELEEMHTAEQDFFKTSLDEDEKYWQAKLATVTGNGKHEQTLRRQIEHELFQIHKQQAQQQRQLDEEDIAAKRQRGLDEIEAAREALAIEQEMGEINGQQRVTALRTLLDKEYQLKHQALEDELKLNDLNAVAKAKLLHQLEELDRQHSLKLMKNDAELYAEKKATWGKLLDPVTSAISQSVQAMIMQTATLRKIMANMMQSITGAFAAAIAEQVKDWAKGELAKTALTKQGTITRTFLEKVGLLDVLKTQTSTDTMAAESTQARTAAELPAVAGVAAGKAAEAVAPTPWVGPVLAAAAFASVMGMIMNSRGHAVGSWKVPGDMITKVHAGEMIVPEQFAKNVREGGALGGGGGTVHLHVNAIDAVSVRRLFKNNGAAIAESLRRQARNFTPMKV